MKKEKYKFPCEIDLETYIFIKMISDTAGETVNETINEICNDFVDAAKKILTQQEN